MEAVVSLQEAIAGVAERVGPSVVGLGRGWDHGSGVGIGKWLVLTNAHNLRREQVTVVVANPGGRGLRVTLGFVSSEGRSFRGPRGRRIGGAIEHTAPLPRGSSGGPLVDVEGRLLGLNALRLDGGLILAVPATAAVKERAARLARGDLLVSAGGRELDGVDALYESLDAVPEQGGTIDLTIVRGTEERPVTVEF